MNSFPSSRGETLARMGSTISRMGFVVLEALRLAGITQGFKRGGVPSARFGAGGRMDTGEIDKDGESLSLTMLVEPSWSSFFSSSVVVVVVFMIDRSISMQLMHSVSANTKNSFSLSMCNNKTWDEDPFVSQQSMRKKKTVSWKK